MKKFVLAWSVFVLGLLLIASLAGCGGVSSKPAPTPTPTPTPNPSPTPPGPTPTPTPTPAAHGTFVFVDGVETAGEPTDAYRLNPDGTLTLVPGSPFPISGFLASGGGFLMVANSTSLSAYAIDPATGKPAVAGNGAIFGTFALAADARDVYVAGLSSTNANNVIYGFSIGPTGVLTPLPGSPFLLSEACELCSQPVSMAVNNSFVVVGTSGFHGAGGILALPRSANGTLGTPQPGGVEEQGAVTIQRPNGNAAFAIDGTLGAVQPYTIDATGKPTEGSLATSGTSSFIDETVDATGKFLLVLDNSVVHIFSIDQATANLTQIGTSESVGQSARFINIDPSGRFVIVGLSGTPPSPDQITVFTFDPASGAMKKLQSYPVGKSPLRSAIITE